ncbi:NADH-dependent alcohol dehydrogenase, partial [Streptococcus pyogenes]
FFRDQLEIPMVLSEVGIKNQELVREMSEKAVEHGNLGQNIFVTLDADDVENIISASFEAMETF